jgi:hypothetical protein
MWPRRCSTAARCRGLEHPHGNAVGRHALAAPALAAPAPTPDAALGAPASAPASAVDTEAKTAPPVTLKFTSGKLNEEYDIKGVESIVFGRDPKDEDARIKDLIKELDIPSNVKMEIIPLSDDNTNISRIHFALVYIKGDWRLVDLKSSQNTTFISNMGTPEEKLAPIEKWEEKELMKGKIIYHTSKFRIGPSDAGPSGKGGIIIEVNAPSLVRSTAVPKPALKATATAPGAAPKGAAPKGVVITRSGRTSKPVKKGGRTRKLRMNDKN